MKGVDLAKFSGEDKTNYEPWKAAFMAMVDMQNIPVGEKMLRLQSSLAGKALTLVNDLGYSSAAYERAKSKLENRYGGERRQQIKQLTTLRNWPKVPSHNLQDLEEFQALLERILITINNCGSLQDQSLNLSAKEKLTERDVQAFYAPEDCFESLVDWVELRVQVMEEAREETAGFGKKNEERVTRIVMKNRVSEDSTHDFQPDIVLLADANKTIHHGFVMLSRDSLYRRERN